MYSWCTEKKWNRNVKKSAETVDGKSKVGRCAVLGIPISTTVGIWES